MYCRLILTAAIGALTATLAHAAGAPDRLCAASSGATRTALVELYTSEGCSSCPPADAALARLDRTLDPGARAVPIALHVDYWDDLGWKDPYAQSAFSARHSRLVAANHHETVYTPHFFVSGRELRAGSGAVREAVRGINAEAAPASVQASARPGADGIAIDLTAHADPSADAALYVAVTQSGLAADVTRGENRGTRLAHDHVARTWIGPLPLANGAITLHRELPAAGPRSALVAFVQDGHTGEILQAVATAECLGPESPARP